jgi:chromosomal replication initiation ATPase DnaA
MKVQEILKQYSEAALDKISADKVDEAVNLRLPTDIIIQEVADALNSLTYVARELAPTRPPTYAFLKILLESPGYSLHIEGFQEKVLSETKELTNMSESGIGFSSDKDYPLYLKILKKAWEDDVVERSEALLLEALRSELGIWTREHLILEHHPDIFRISDFSSAYVSARNHLLVTGLVLTYDNNYILGDEVAVQIRRAWGIDLENDSYQRLLNYLTKIQLHNALEKTGLNVTGSKEEQIQRIINALVPPVEVLGFLHIEELRELCRHSKAQVSGLKTEVIGNIIEHFDQGQDSLDDKEPPKSKLPEEPEERELDNQVLTQFLKQLSNDQLYDILSSSFLKTSGTKELKINRLVDSPWSERSMLSRLRRVELSNVCRKLGVQVSGVKNELIDRLLEWGARIPDTAKAVEEDLETQQEAKKITTLEETTDMSVLNDADAKPIPVAGLEDIRKMYPQLEPDEQAIIALIKDTKSLTEQDINRASRNHGFNWFLTKAHMAEMVAKLKARGDLPIRVRSVKSINIYEWTGSKEQQKEEIEKQAARNVIDALRQGVVPDKNLDALMVGQESARDHLIELLEEIHANKSAFKFIRGPYGAGKTFLCAWLRQYALEHEYVVSMISIGPDQPLSDLPVFFSGVINGIRTPEKRDANALVDVLESWLLSVHRKTAQVECIGAFDRSTWKTLMPLVEERIETELANISNIDQCFSSALRAFYHARLVGDQSTASSAVAWLSGSRSVPTKSLNELGVRGYLEANQVFSRMRALLEIIGGSRFKGLLLMVDELELIRKFPHTHQREQALETLRLLIDETGKNGFPGCLLIFTGTDTFFEDDRAGIKSYEALDNRVTIPDVPGRMVSVRQPVIRLEGLNDDRLLSVVQKVRDIHGIAYDWNANQHVSNNFLEKLVQEWTSFGDENVTRKPRPVLRELIHLLDLCEENPRVDIDEFSRIPVNTESMAKEIERLFE